MWYGWDISQRLGLCLGLVSPPAVAHIWITGRRQFIMTEQKLSGLRPKIVLDGKVKISKCAWLYETTFLSHFENRDTSILYLEINKTENKDCVLSESYNTPWCVSVCCGSITKLCIHQLSLHVSLCVSWMGFVDQSGGRTILLFPVCVSRASLVQRWKTRLCPPFPLAEGRFSPALSVSFTNTRV